MLKLGGLCPQEPPKKLRLAKSAKIVDELGVDLRVDELGVDESRTRRSINRSRGAESKSVANLPQP